LTSLYTEPDDFRSDAALSQLRDRLLAQFASRLRVAVQMPLEEPFEVVWTDHQGKRNAFFAGVAKPNYAGQRAWTLCINSGIKIQREVIDRFLSDAPIKARELAAGGKIPEQSRDWSPWKVIIIAGQEEIVVIANWMAELANARIGAGALPTPPSAIGRQDMRRIFEDDSHQYFTSQGHSAMRRDNPFPS